MERTCKQCGTEFEITDEDLAFYDKVSPVFNGKKEVIPPPMLCPDCRQQRRLAWRNERAFHHRTCHRCDKGFLTIYAPANDLIVYCPTCWWGDEWNQYATGKSFDMNRTFMEQFKDLIRVSPLLSLLSMKNENSEYVNLESDDKNCYMNIGGHYNQDCYYNTYSLQGKNCMDNYWIFQGELLYGSLDCSRSYNSAFLRQCILCNNCIGCYDLQGCTNCIGCTGLRHKENYLWNEPASPEAIDDVRRSAASAKGLQEILRRADEYIIAQPRKFCFQERALDCTGDYITNSSHCIDSYNCDECQDLKYSSIAASTKDGYDLNSVGWGELCYEAVAVGAGHNLLFCCTALHDTNCLYCFNVWQSEHCFGCVGLHRAKYCIFNKQYSQEEYERIVPTLIDHMRRTGEWGEFFQLSLSPFGYNGSVAQEYFPLTKEETIAHGWKWYEEEHPRAHENLLPASQLPDNIDQVTDDILNLAIECNATKRPFRIIKQELELYRQLQLPIPRFHPDERHRRRLALRNPRKLWNRNCANCQKPIMTSYAPERPEIIYCESCYLQTVY